MLLSVLDLFRFPKLFQTLKSGLRYAMIFFFVLSIYLLSLVFSAVTIYSNLDHIQ